MIFLLGGIAEGVWLECLWGFVRFTYVLSLVSAFVGLAGGFPVY